MINNNNNLLFFDVLTMKKSSRPSETKTDIEKLKRIYRAACDVIRRHDEILKQKKAFRDVFLPEAIAYRNKLQDYCEWLMFHDPQEYGRKAEELLWRKVYYDVIQLMKHNKKQMRLSASLEGAFRTHLIAATGFYHHLLFKLQKDYNLKLDGVVDLHHIADPKSYKKPHQIKKQEHEPKVVEWAIKACHRCLVYLGDIARYLQEYEGMRTIVVAQHYYFQAVSLCPDIGMPYNQLGTLAGSRYYNIDAAYHYLRCLSCPSSFEGARGNLMRLFEKNKKRYVDVNQVSPRDLRPDQQRSKDIKRFLVRFMHLLTLFMSDIQKLDMQELQETCQTTLQDFNLVMFYQPPHVLHPNLPPPRSCHPDERLPYMDDDIIFKIVVICMIVIYQLQRQGGSKQMTASIAFSLALFSHILNHAVIRLQSALYELEHPSKIIPETVAEDDMDNQCDIQESETAEESQPAEENDEAMQENGAEKPTGDVKDAKTDCDKLDKKRKKLKMMRLRRRRRASSDSSEDSQQESEQSDDSDLSEGGQLDTDTESDNSDEVIDYMQPSPDASSSDSEDNLMVSQELRPGFSEHRCSNNSTAQANQESMPDMTEYLKNLQDNFFTDSSNFFSDTLKLTNLFSQTNADDELTPEVSAVVQSKKEVRMPPGFDKDPEALYVEEVSQKLASFVIETDDTENSSLPNESEIDGETTETDQESTDSIVDKVEIEEQRLSLLLQVISREGLLRCIKIYCDWMRCHPHIIATCAQSSQSLWSRLSVLLNFLPLESDLAKKDFCDDVTVLNMVEKASMQDWNPSVPLQEDVHLACFPPLKDAYSTLQFSPNKQPDLNSQQEAVLRICCLRKFGYIISRMKSVQFSYDTEKFMFYGPLQLESQLDEKSAQEKMANAEARRNQLMKDMAQLRLQAEVSQLEGSLESTADAPSLPPYLVPDATALTENLQQIKQLTSSARFIVIIALAVIDHLDFLKKERGGAREAIRWLEAEFRRGNRYIRAQKNHEKTSTIPHKNLKKRDRDAWRFLQIVDCCKYLSQQSAEMEGRGMVCVLTNLTGEEPNLSLRYKQALLSAPQEGISIQKPSDFFNKWKEAWKGSKG